MPHAALKLVGGANVAETPAQNENGGIAETNLIRYVYDPGGMTLVAKLGGWESYYPAPMAATVRALWGWEDINAEAHLAVGTQTYTSGGVNRAQLAVITNGTLLDITPQQTGTISFLPTGYGVYTYEGLDYTLFPFSSNVFGGSLYFPVQIAAGGIVIFGFYPAFNGGGEPAGVGGLQIFQTDQLGNPLLAPSTSGGAYTTPSFATTQKEFIVQVTLPGYTYAVGDTFPILVPVSVGGIVLFGNYVVQETISSSVFTILGNTQATSAATVSMNGGLGIIIYCDTTSNAQYPPDPLPVPITSASDWTLDNFGEYLIACAVQPANTTPPLQPIYQWAPGQTYATVIPQAPPVNDGIFVAMPQRQIIAWGSTETGIQDPLLISWCDVNNPNQWIPLVTNQAGNYRIPKGSKIVGGIQGPTQGLIWTDIDVWSMQYIGPPYVYSFNEIGTGCGLIARHAAASANGIVWWMGPKQFFTLSSNGVQPLPCPVWDVIFQNLNQSQWSNIRVGVNSLFNEISWFFTAASTGASQNDSYVKYNYLLNLWDYGIGTLGRSAWIDQSVLGPPIGADPVSLNLYQHETSNDAGGTAMNSYFQTGYYALNETDVKSFVDWVKPDAKWSTDNTYTPLATLQISFVVADYAGQVPTVYGPYSVMHATEYFYTRFRARLMAIRVESDDLGSYWRIGMLRYRFAPDGKI